MDISDIEVDVESAQQRVLLSCCFASFQRRKIWKDIQRTGSSCCTDISFQEVTKNEGLLPSARFLKTLGLEIYVAPKPLILLHSVTPDSLMRILNSGSPLPSIRRLLKGDGQAGFSPRPHICCQQQWQGAVATVLECSAHSAQLLPVSQLSSGQHIHWCPWNCA